MICSRIVDETHLVTKENKYIVDTNILLYLYGNDSFRNVNDKTKILSKKYITALDLGCDVYVPAIVISEFVNRFHKSEFDMMKNKSREKLNYKRDYRDTKKYIENNKYIIENVVQKTILDRCKVISDGFVDSDLDKIFALGENQEFNDNLIIDIANRNNLFLISADRDSRKILIK